MLFNLNIDIAFYGIQGSGKTTQSEILAKKTGATFFYFGAELRQRIAVGDELAQKMDFIQSQGISQPPEHLRVVIDDFFARHPEGDRFIYDTPARIPSQKPLWDQILRDKQKKMIIIFLQLDEEIARERLIGQGARHDSSPEAINKRIEVFYNETVPVIEQYRTEGVPVFDIDASKPIENIADKIEEILLEKKIMNPSAIG